MDGNVGHGGKSIGELEDDFALAPDCAGFAQHLIQNAGFASANRTFGNGRAFFYLGRPRGAAASSRDAWTATGLPANHAPLSSPSLFHRLAFSLVEKFIDSVTQWNKKVNQSHNFLFQSILVQGDPSLHQRLGTIVH